MIEFAKITGETDENYIRVKVRTGEEFLAPMAVIGNSSAIPSEKWINDNKDKFLALIAYEKDILSNPIVIGFYPIKSSDARDYDVLYQVIDALSTLIKELQSVKTTTLLGPQTFFADSLIKIKKIETTIESIKTQCLGL